MDKRVATGMTVARRPANPQSRDVALAKRRLLPRYRGPVGRACPLWRLDRFDVVVDLVLLERAAERRRHRPRDAVALVAVVEHVKKDDALVLANRRRSRWIDQVPARKTGWSAKKGFDGPSF